MHAGASSVRSCDLPRSSIIRLRHERPRHELIHALRVRDHMTTLRTRTMERRSRCLNPHGPRVVVFWYRQVLMSLSRQYTCGAIVNSLTRVDGGRDSMLASSGRASHAARLLRERIAHYSLPLDEDDGESRHVVDALVLDNTAIVAYNEGRTQVSCLRLNQVSLARVRP